MGPLFEVYRYRRQVFAAWLLVLAVVVASSQFDETHPVFMKWLIGRVWLTAVVLVDAVARLIPMIMFAVTASRLLVFLALG